MQRHIWQAAGYLGMSTEILDRVYGHHTPDHLKGAAEAITGKNKAKISVVVSVVEKIEAREQFQNPVNRGGPGRTRTSNQTVMSGRL
jgi:hypothetical protein